MVHRGEVISHLEWVANPWLTGRFIDETINAVEVSAAGRGDELIELGGERLKASEAVEIWELDEMVERVRGGEPIRHGPDIDDPQERMALGWPPDNSLRDETS